MIKWNKLFYQNTKRINGLQNFKSFSTNPETEAARNARKLRAASAAKRPPSSSTNNSSSKYGILIAGISGITGGLLYAIYDIQNNKDGFLGKIYYGSVLDSGINWMKKQFNDNYQKIMYPSDDKLLPDFKSGPFYGDIPPGTPAPPLLVVDLERTLIGSVYDAKHGWRHVKRPGVDKFIDQLRQYYEIVIFSENDKGMTLDIMDAIGKEHTHKFGSSEAEVRDGIVIKRLDYMNRPLSKIVLIDDDPAAAQMFPRNTLLIKPFTNIYDKNDTALLELVPLLQALVHEGISDFRESFDALGTHDAHEASVEYKMRVVRTKSSEHEKRNRGLGKLIRGQSSITEDHKDDMSVSRVVPTPTEIVGAPPVTNLGPGKKNDKPAGEKKKGMLFSWLEETEKEKAEVEQRKLEKMQEIQQRRLQEQQLIELRKQRELEDKARLERKI